MSQRGAGLLRALRLSSEMSKFLNKNEASRVDITRAIWAHVKDKNLQDPADKRMIKIDDQLRPIFEGKDKIHMFEIAKFINNHVKKE